jgi:hypothetical protein
MKLPGDGWLKIFDTDPSLKVIYHVRRDAQISHGKEKI